MVEPNAKAKQEESARRALKDADAELDSVINEVRTRDNGIQYIMTSVLSNNEWELPKTTEFLGEDHSVPPKKKFFSEATAHKIKAFADIIGSKAFEAAQNGTRSDAKAVPCPDIPDEFSRLLLYRWSREANGTFIFLAGGVGPERLANGGGPYEKEKQFRLYSQSELDSKKSVLTAALEKYAQDITEIKNRS